MWEWIEYNRTISPGGKKKSHECHVPYAGNYEALMDVGQLLKPRSETKD